jgi:hypothetical protein
MEHPGYDMLTTRGTILFVFTQFFLGFPGLIDTVHTRRPLTDLMIALRPSSNGLNGVGQSMVINSHRMLVLALLCVGLFVASGPAIACCAQGTATQDCCPTRSHEIRSQSDLIGSPYASQSCCAVAAQTAMGTVFDVMPSKAEHQADAPFSLIYLATLSTTDTVGWVEVSSTTPAVPALFPVYLRTGRLRL